MEYSKINSSQILTIHYWNLDLFEDNQKKYLLLSNVAFLLLPIIPFAIFYFDLRQRLSLFLPIMLITINISQLTGDLRLDE